MPEKARPKKENYVECSECSKVAGEPVIYHKSSLVKSEELFGEDSMECPKGHEIKSEPVEDD